LPESLGLPTFSEAKPTRKEIGVFFSSLNESLNGLSGAASSAINTARDVLLGSCGFEEGAEHWPSLRTTAVALEPAVTDPRLLAFLKRVTQNGDDRAGIESVLALVANRPPRNWSDMDVDRFPEAAAAIGKAFRDAARSTGVSSNADAQLAALPPKERRQAEAILDRVKNYLRCNAKNSTPRTLRAAVAKLLEELGDE